jgi:hypothetical protein
MKCMRMGGGKGATARVLRIIDIVNRVCRIVIKSVQQCTYFLFFVNLLLVHVNYGQRTMQVCS